MAIETLELAVFTSVVRLESFAGAAEAHALSASAVSRLIARLEEKLGVRLIQRDDAPAVVDRGGRHLPCAGEPYPERPRGGGGGGVGQRVAAPRHGQDQRSRRARPPASGRGHR